MKKIIRLLLLSFTMILILGGGFLSYMLLEGTPPQIVPVSMPKVVGKVSEIRLKASDNRSGIKEIVPILEQNGKKFAIPPRRYTSAQWWLGSGVRDVQEKWVIKAQELGLKEGPAKLLVSVRDSSFRNVLKGNEATFEQEVIVDFSPPRIALKSLVHNIRSGGAGLVSYKLNEPAVKTGVLIDDLFFPGISHPSGRKNAYISLIALPFDKQRVKKFLIEAVDEAGNISRMGIPHKIFYKRPKRDRINISDNFLERKMPYFEMNYPWVKGATLLDTFLKVNRELRRKNGEEIKAICSRITPERHWEGAFKRLPGSASRANFADERYYYYKGKKIDRQFHMGVDLASRRHAKVMAANHGKVVFADSLGIYGNTIIIDHGLGLYSMYSHLSEMTAEKGEMVTKGAIIGNTGSTGLAGGDHLHYGMVVNGIFVNPVEWWDGKWIRDHITANINS